MIGNGGVEGGAVAQEHAKPGGHVAGEEGPIMGRSDPAGRGGGVDLQPDDPVAAEGGPGAWVDDGAAAESKYAGPLKQPTGGGVLDTPERQFSPADEKLAGRRPVVSGEICIYVDERQSELSRDERPDGGLAGPGRTDKNDRTSPAHDTTTLRLRPARSAR